jgi:hypothetical protein
MTGLPPIRSGSEYYGTDYMGSHIIVWDLETVPDLTGFAAANDLVGKSDVEIREAIGEKFPKHIYHSIVCIGALIAHRELDHWAVDAVGAPHVGERTEKELITAFCGKLKKPCIESRRTVSRAAACLVTLTCPANWSSVDPYFIFVFHDAEEGRLRQWAIRF